MVGIPWLVRTRAVECLRAMRKWYRNVMSNATDADLRLAAETDLADAQGVLGLPAVVVGWDVSGDDFWSTFAARAAGLLKRAATAPLRIGAKAGGKIRDAARRGLDKASDATSDAKRALGAVATAAGVLAMGPGILLGLLAFVVVEGSGYGGRARRGARRYVSQRARAYGVY